MAVGPLRAVALLVALASATSAQLPARRDLAWSSPFAIVLDSTDLARGRGRSLSAFLAGRVPGLSISVAEWPATRPPQVMSSTTSGSFALPEPRLYVDGILIRDDPAWDNAADGSNLAVGQVPPSMGWDIPLEDVAEVRVLLGPAGSGELNWGGSRGAVLVTTRRGRADRMRVWSAVQATSATVRFDPKANWAAFGTTAGGPTTTCRLADQASGTCTSPAAAVSWSPLAELLPVMNAFAYRTSVGASGPLFSHLTYRATATDGAGEGGLPGNRAHRTDASLSLAWDDARWLSLVVDARYGRIASKRAGWNAMDLDTRATEWGGVASDSVRTAMRLLRAYTADRALDRFANRYTAAAHATIRVTRSTEVDLGFGHDELDRYSWADYIGAEYCAAGWLLDCWSSQRVEDIDRGNVSEDVKAASIRHRMRLTRAIGAELRAAVSDEDTKLWYVAGEIILPDDQGNWHQTWVGYGLPIREAAARITVADRGAVSATYRKAAHLNKMFDGEWDLVRISANGRPSGLTRLTGIAAYGESDDGRSTAPVAVGTTFPDFPADRTTERRFGLVAQWGPRIEVAIDRSTATTSNGTLLNRIAGSGLATVWYASWRVEATQARIGVRSAPGSSVPWWSRLSVVERIARLTDLPGADLHEDLLDGNSRTLGAGSPLTDIWNHRFTFVDANGDGVIAPTEVTIASAARPLGSTEPRWMLFLTGGVELPGGISLDAVVESRLGQVAFDRTSYVQCRVSACGALYRPNASLKSQAAAIAAAEYENASGFIQDASFARLRELSLEYRFGDASRLDGMTVRLTGHDLLTLTSFPGADPEAMSLSGAVPSGVGLLGHRVMPAVTLRVAWQQDRLRR